VGAGVEPLAMDPLVKRINAVPAIDAAGRMSET
jgi:hypothetical protein